MTARVRLWRQRVKHHPVATVLISLSALLVVLVLLGGYKLNWGWTGFNGSSKSGKTLWDWMQLLFIPVVLAVAGFWFNHRERKAAELRSENERKAAELRAEAERDIEQQRSKAEQEIASDNQREAALQAYINSMSGLLLHEKLRESAPENEVRKIARVRTLTVLPRLDGKRKRNLLLFLYDADLIDRGNQIIDVSEADFSKADLNEVRLSKLKWVKIDSNKREHITRVNVDLRGVNLQNANLNGADLSGAILGAESEIDLNLGNSTEDIANLSEATLIKADLSRAVLGGVDLSGADLSGANLDGAILICTNLSEANLQRARLSIESFIQITDEPEDINTWDGVDLSKANLSRANLSEANLWKANLSGANLSEANIWQARLSGANMCGANLKGAIGVTSEKLEEQAESLKGAIMPDGSKHP